MELEHKAVTEQIIGAAFEVYGALGYGFLEKVYQRAMVVELRERGLVAELETPIAVYYKGVEVGHYFADIFVEKSVMVELKVAKNYCPEDEPQLLNRTQGDENPGRIVDQLRPHQGGIQTNGVLTLQSSDAADEKRSCLIRVSSVFNPWLRFSEDSEHD